MKKLMLTGCAVLALMGSAHAEDKYDALRQAYAATAKDRVFDQAALGKMLDSRDPKNDPILKGLKPFEQVHDPIAEALKSTEQEAPIKELGQCDDKGVLDTLQRITHSYTIDGASNLRSADPTQLRYCKARVVGPWGFVEVVYTIEWLSMAEGRFWVSIQASHGY